MSENQMKPVWASDAPNVLWLQKELDRSKRDDALAPANDIRYTRWDGQSSDGRKWQRNLPKDKRVFPFDGASDTRIPLVDDVINSMVDICTTSFWRAGLKVNAAEASDSDRAMVGQRIMDYLVTSRLYNELCADVELLAQYGWTHGWGVVAVTWTQEATLRRQQVTLEELPPEVSQVVLSGADDQAAELLKGLFPNLRKRRALAVVRDLRESEQSEVPVQEITRNSPVVTALLPYDEFVMPPETTDLQSAPVLFWRTYLTETALRAKAATDGWDQTWVEAACRSAGTDGMRTVHTPETIRGAVSEHQDELIEVVYAYQRLLDDDDVPGVYCTVFSPSAANNGKGAELYGKHELVDYGHGQYPFVEYRPEVSQRRLVMSRGVPDIAFTWQDEVKVQRDSISDYTSLSTLPPIEVPKSRAGNLMLQPGGQLPVLRRGEIGYLELPQRDPTVAFTLMDNVERQVDNYFGRMRPDSDPSRTQLRQQRVVNTWLQTWTRVFQQLFALCVQYYSPEELNRITGMDTEIPRSYEFDLLLKFDVRELQTDFTVQKLKSIADFVLPADAAGVVDRAKLVQLSLRAIDPNLADMVVSDQAGARQQMFHEQRDAVAQMFLGNEAVYQEKDPTATMKLQMIQSILQANPVYQQGLQQGGRFAELLKKYVDHLGFQAQQQLNAQIGRIGVEPSSAQI